jgi:hypothetical protein
VAYPNIKLTQSLKDSGAIRIIGPLGDDPPGLAGTHVFATVTQQPERNAAQTFGDDGPSGIMGTGEGWWDAGNEEWNVLAQPPAGSVFASDAWAWVNALAVRRYDNGNMDTLSWSRWVQVQSVVTGRYARDPCASSSAAARSSTRGA